MRLFTGIALPGEIVGNLEDLIKRLQPKARIRWSPAKNLHITTKFIGEWDANRLDELRAALADVTSPGPIRIAIRGLGWFPNPRAPRVLWAGVEADDALRTLAARTDEKLAGLGVPAEKRKYSPHLTLARIKDSTDLRALREAVDASPVEFGEFEAVSYHLYLSELNPGGSIYTSLKECTL